MNTKTITYKNKNEIAKTLASTASDGLMILDHHLLSRLPAKTELILRNGVLTWENEHGVTEFVTDKDWNQLTILELLS
jgi:hypothetical protein